MDNDHITGQCVEPKNEAAANANFSMQYFITYQIIVYDNEIVSMGWLAGDKSI